MDDTNSSENWAAEYYHQQELARQQQGWKTLLRPSVIGAFLAVAGRVVVGPIALLVLFLGTGYLSDGTVLIESDEAIFAFTESDMSMAAGCTGCLGPCKIALLKYSLFDGDALTTSPTFNAFTALPPTESLYDFSSLTDEALELAERLDSEGTICQTGISEWGSIHDVVTGTAQQVLDVITVMGLNVAPQMIRELELAIVGASACETTWNLLAIGRLFQYPTSVGDSNFVKLSAADLNVFPDYTECRPVVTIDDNLVGAKLALATNGQDPLLVYPEVLSLFPYAFTSNIPPVSREVPAGTTKYGSDTVVLPLLRGYYGACRVREVNTTGIYVEDTCTVSKHWENYGLMVHSPDDIPLCSRGDVCIHNYFNSLWEWVNYQTADKPDRVGMIVNSSRSRYADTVAISVLPGVIVMQNLIMGVISLYQVMSHKRSVLLTQIWAYRCQNGRMQVVYLAQVTYHLIYTSDLYLLGLATGTLTTESIANLMCCAFAFSYSFVNLVKARSGDQKLDRHFRLTWEAMQIFIAIAVWCVLISFQTTPIDEITTKNAELLRKTTARGAEYCGLNDACLLFTVNLAAITTILSLALGFVALFTSVIVKKTSTRVKSAMQSVRRLSLGKYAVNQSRSSLTAQSAPKVAASNSSQNGSVPPKLPPSHHEHLTSFEKHCIGAPFNKLFHDCDDIAYVTYRGQKCTTVEALLLTSYLYYGAHIYQASSVMLLLAARVIPRKILRTFNMLLLRWYVDPKDGTLSEVLSCTWYTASGENHKLAGATPVA